MTDEQDHQYSVQISGPKGLHVIAVVAGSDREAVGKLRTVAGRNNIHTDVFYQDGRRLHRAALLPAHNNPKLP